MPIITIISDWTMTDFYLSAMKGRILNLMPYAKIIDISHTKENANINQTAFILNHSYKNYPNRTIHLICIGTELKKNENYLIVHRDSQYFIAKDSGIFSLIFNQEQISDEVIIKADLSKYQITTFPELDIFTDLAQKIVETQDIIQIGERLENYKKLYLLNPTYEKDLILGRVIYIDGYGNAITNISYELFEQVGKQRNMTIYVKTNRTKITKISKKYYHTTDGDILAIFNSLGLLEIAQYKGNISEIYNFDHDTSVRINFENI